MTCTACRCSSAACKKQCDSLKTACRYKPAVRALSGPCLALHTQQQGGAPRPILAEKRHLMGKTHLGGEDFVSPVAHHGQQVVLAHRLGVVRQPSLHISIRRQDIADRGSVREPLLLLHWRTAAGTASLATTLAAGMTPLLSSALQHSVRQGYCCSSRRVKLHALTRLPCATAKLFCTFICVSSSVVGRLTVLPRSNATIALQASST